MGSSRYVNGFAPTLHDDVIDLPMRETWAQDIREQCEDQGVVFFFKQWGGVGKEKFGRELNGRTYDAMPGQRVIPIHAAV